MKNLYLILTLMLLISCQENDLPFKHSNDTKISPSSKNSEFMKVYKQDGATQCSTSGLPVNVMSRILTNAGIDVVCSQKSIDLFYRQNICGEATGSINIFKIYKSNLNSAIKLGFLSTKLIPGAIISKCDRNSIPKTPTYVKVYKSYHFNNICSDRKYPVEVMARDLITAGVNIACSKKGSHLFFKPNSNVRGVQTAVCKGSTKGFNVYKINLKDIAKAKNIGFNPVSELPNYVDTKCSAPIFKFPIQPISNN